LFLIASLLLTAITPVAFGSLAATEAIISAADGSSGDRFGTAVAISSNTVVVGAFLDSDAGSQSGSAYVYVRNGDTWTQQQKLTAADATAGDVFGVATAISGETIVVGAYADSDAGSQSGSAYVFVRNGDTWTQQQKLTAADAAANDIFGLAVAIVGDTIVVGAAGKNSGAGAVYVFGRSGTVWTQQTKLLAADAAANNFFGGSVSLNGDTLAVGAPGRKTYTGATYVFVRTGTNWTQQAQLFASDAAKDDHFGNSTDISGDTLVVGANQNDDAGSKSGSAYVFVRTGTTWKQKAKLTASDATAGEFFGSAVGISGNLLVVGSSGSDSAYVFTRSSGIWSESTKLTPADAVGGPNNYGFLAINRGTVVLGGPLNNSGRGATYIYELPDCQLSVPYFSQCNPTWSTNTYAKTAKTICAKGCAVACMSMALNYLGVTQLTVGGVPANNNPGTLNQFMLENPGDFSGGDVNWGPTTRDASANQLVWNKEHIDATDADGFSKAATFFENTICTLGYPVIVGVDMDADGSPTHFVLVTGRDAANNYLINDPRHSDWHSLTNYNNRFKTRGFLSPPPPAATTLLTAAPSVAPALALGNRGALYVGVSPHAQLFVTDPTGLRTGITPATTNELEEISESVQFTDALTDDETDEPPTEATHFVYIDQPADGDYQLQVTGLTGGAFELNVRAFARDGSALPAELIEGTVAAGITTNVTVSFAGAPPEPHDLAVVKMKAPKKISLSATVTNVVGKFSVSIQNRSAHSEVITDMTMLRNLVTLAVQTLGACPDVTPVMLPPKGTFPVTLLPKKKLTLTFTAAFDCANDQLAGAGHEDFRSIASVHHNAIDGLADTHPADDNCPRAPLPGGTDPNPDPSKPLKDTGCAGGVEVKTDVFIK
jgi:hypothetical protein